jgi:hypothetical protein
MKMKISLVGAAFLTIGLCGITRAEVSGTVSAVQARARPDGLSIVAPVEIAGSDTASATFDKSVLPSIDTLINVRLKEWAKVPNVSTMALDPSKLVLATDSTARVYFVGEGASFHNTLGFNTIDPGKALPSGGLSSDAQLIFPDASSTVSSYDPGKNQIRSASEPLLPGDFVDLGTYKAGTSLDFFLISNGANGGGNVFTAEAARNPDKIDHVVAFALSDSPYLILAYEDLYGGGDRDYNDVIVAVDIGKANIQRLVSAPEPGTWMILTGFMGLALFQTRRRLAQA